MRTPPKPLDAYRWRSEHEIRFADIDMLGHVNNGAFGSYMESSRSTLMANIGMIGETSIALVRFEIDYIREMRWPGRVIATSAVESVGRSSFRLRQATFQGDTCTAEAVATLVRLNLTTRRAELIDDALRVRLEEWRLA